MPRYYTYLIASLPFLHFEREPPFSFSDFLERCADFIGKKELDILKTIPEKEPEISKIKQETLRRWFLFEFALRNELVKLRAMRKGEDPYNYLREVDYPLSNYILDLINQAFKNPSPLEAEKMLDRIRWDFLEDLEFGHFFDFDFLIIYGIKLLILERWEKIEKVDKKVLLEKLIA